MDPVDAEAGAEEEAAAATDANATATICFMVVLTAGSRLSSKTGVRSEGGQTIQRRGRVPNGYSVIPGESTGDAGIRSEPDEIQREIESKSCVALR